MGMTTAFMNTEVQAARGGGESGNGCGLSGQSGEATSNDRGVGEGTSDNAQEYSNYIV
jgi:hypothetical protein